MSKNIDPVEFKINASTIAMAAKIKPLLTLGDTNGEIQTIKVDDGLLAATMEGTELTPEGMASYNRHLEEVVNAVSMVAGEMSVEAFKASKDVKKTQTQAKLIPGMSVDVAIQKEKQVPNMDRENPGTKTVYGSTVARVTLVATANKGLHKKVRAFNAASIEAICS